MLAEYVNSKCDKLNVWLEHRSFYSLLEHPFPAHEKPDLLVYLYSIGFICFMDLFNDTENYVKRRHHGVFHMFRMLILSIVTLQ